MRVEAVSQIETDSIKTLSLIVEIATIIGRVLELAHDAANQFRGNGVIHSDPQGGSFRISRQRIIHEAPIDEVRNIAVIAESRFDIALKAVRVLEAGHGVGTNAAFLIRRFVEVDKTAANPN